MNRSSFFNMSTEQFNRLLAVLIAVVTMFAAVVAYLQADASTRDDRANRDGKRYAIEAFGRQVSGDARVNFDNNVAYQAVYELQLLASSAETREDLTAVERYAVLADEARTLSPLMQAPYYDEQVGDPDVGRYASETYVVEITTLREKFKAADVVKGGWDSKANTYIVHLTLLAVVLFLLGLAGTLPGRLPRWIFVGSGLAIALVTVGWVLNIWSQPVFDLRSKTGAIEEYAAGVGLSYQEKYPEAIAAFDRALAAYPSYTAAWADRADANFSLGEVDAAIADYEKARAVGNKTPYVAGNLAYAYYLQGRFDEAVAMNQTALKAGDELWIQFDLGLALLAQGKFDEAQAAYQQGMDNASQAVAKARQAGEEPPSFLWESLLDGANGLDDLLWTLESGEGQPAPDTIADADATSAKGEELMAGLKNLALALEYEGAPVAASAMPAVEPFFFTTVLLDEAGEIVDSEPMEVFEYGIDEIVVNFDYAGMKDGDVVAFKLYLNSEEDPSWRIVEPWSLGDTGQANITLSYAYSDTFVFDPGEYTVELYVNYQLVQRGFFSVEE